MNTLSESGSRSSCGRPVFWRGIARLLLFLLVCSGLASPGQSGQAAALPPQEPGSTSLMETQYVTIPAAAFHPTRNGVYDYLNSGFMLHVTSSSTPGYTHFYADLHLPHFATINKIKFLYSDWNPTYNCHLYFNRTAVLSETFPPVNLADLHSTGSSGIGVDITAVDWPNVQVQNAGYDYYFEFRGYGLETNPTDLLYVIIEYTPSSSWIEYEYLNVPPAAFTPFSSNEGLVINLGYGIEYRGDNPNIHFQAPVILPDGVTASSAYFYWFDDNSSNASAHLHRTNLAGSWDPADAMIDLASQEEEGFGVDSGSISRYQLIQNGANAYWVYYDLPYSEPALPIYGRGLMISYRRPLASFPIQSISIPAAAFTPITGARTYENHGRFIKNYGPGSTYVAPVYLPHGKYVRRMKFYYERLGTPVSEGTALLRGWTPGALITDFVTLTSSGSGWGMSDSDLLHGIQIDNEWLVYWLEWRLPTTYSESDHVLPTGVVIEVWGEEDLKYLPLVIK